MILRLLSDTRSREQTHQLGEGIHGIHERLRSEIGAHIRQQQVMEILWQLLADGLVYVDYGRSASQHWSWELTQRGKAVMEGASEFEPHDPEGYLSALKRRIPDLDPGILHYVAESVRAFNSQCFLASTVMLGVAAERGFQTLGEAFANWLPASESQAFGKIFENARTTYVEKFREFRKRLEPHKPDLPVEFTENMSLNLDVVLDLLRVSRNEAGHPTGKRVIEGDAYTSLQMFARFLSRLDTLRLFFVSNPRDN
jgi:hypothetical protein